MILDIRLRTAADMVPPGARLADIGSDHAYLPIALALEGKITCALASDINEGPVAAALTNIKKNGLADKITAIRADGLEKARDFHPDCITVLGMGGELIRSILEKAAWIRDPAVTLVLQPMTHPEALTVWLAENGFSITDERIVRDGSRDDRIYRLLLARYTGEVTALTTAEALVGKLNLARGDRLTRAYVRRLIRIFETRLQGKQSVSADTAYEEELLRELKYYLLGE